MIMSFRIICFTNEFIIDIIPNYLFYGLYDY
jgi:hypothetical protein